VRRTCGTLWGGEGYLQELGWEHRRPENTGKT